MACLTYKPAPVLFDAKKYDRNTLVEAQGYLLNLALKQLKHLDFNSVESQLLGASASKLNKEASIHQESHFEDVVR